MPLGHVSEYLLAETNSTEKLIIVPAPRVLTENAGELWSLRPLVALRS